MASFPQLPETRFLPNFAQTEAMQEKINSLLRWKKGLTWGYQSAIILTLAMPLTEDALGIRANPYAVLTFNWVRRALMVGGLVTKFYAESLTAPNFSEIYLRFFQQIAAAVGLNIQTRDSAHKNSRYEARLKRLDAMTSGADDWCDHISLQTFRYPLKITYQQGDRTVSTTVDLIPALTWLQAHGSLSSRTGEMITGRQLVSIEFDHQMAQEIQRNILLMEDLPTTATVMADGLRHRTPRMQAPETPGLE